MIRTCRSTLQKTQRSLRGASRRFPGLRAVAGSDGGGAWISDARRRQIIEPALPSSD